MERKEFSIIRHFLNKSQSELAKLLCISPKTIQSFEEGHRKIPAYAERQLLVLLSLKRAGDVSTRPCWDIKKCPAEWKKNCTAWEFKAGYLCWFINGTYCQGTSQDDWHSKIRICRTCEVFRSIIPPLI